MTVDERHTDVTDTYSADEMMTVEASRALADVASCFVGIGLPSTAANLARTTHSPDLVLVYESGCLGSKPNALPLLIGDGMLAEAATSVVSVPALFNYWLPSGLIHVGCLSPAPPARSAHRHRTVYRPGPDPQRR